ncbi:glycoside hydrolase family 95 protein [Actinacidiphila oryziradicis]|uniref:Glycoside hydrolase family 95 protein n=1 Tax=Actinacidiphila oryziradicis TaxID=2571141 RepID=A0A4U0SNW6_9ACTN|nr:glycoside hydrolase family 95 protein [Actinacidiphila oryziradicis]TKA10908.1 glycoside hydrolase family 95 protein [Actinacidiphila oryziradicis]
MLNLASEWISRGTGIPSGALWYARPATRWFEALPIGNGRLGGMVYGGTDRERIQLSESTAWSGEPSTADVSPTAQQYLAYIRELLFAGRHAEAQQLATEHLLGRPESFGTNLPLPEVQLDFLSETPVRDYRRTLDLDTGVASITYEQDGARNTRAVLASNPHGLIAVRLTADRPGSIGFSLAIQDGVIPGRIVATDTGVVLRGHAYENLHSNGQQGVALEIHTRLEAEGGSVRCVDDTLHLEGADAAVVYVAVGTSWAGDDPASRANALLSAALDAGYAAVRAAHIADHQGLMRRVSIDLGSAQGDAAALPTDERRARFASGEADDGLIALYFQFGRYLTVAGSRRNSPLPLALQGLWNDGLASSASWTNDFHLDMNTQQNYWAAEPTNLAECQEPLFRLIETTAAHGRTTATAIYGAPGWVAHTVTNAWGYTAPGSGIGWGLNVTGGAWIALQLWEHYQYGGDEVFLRERVYPVFREAAEFFLAYLVAEPEHGWLVAGPSESPENWYLAPDGSRCSISMGSTADRVFVEAVLRICAESAELLDVDVELRARIASARRLLPPFQIGRHGQLQEWLHDFEEADPSHRHTSHLSALFPERQVTPRDTPALARAAEVTIERRQQAPGWEQTEWVEANFTVYFARLLKGDQALAHLTNLITDASEANLMSYSAGGVAGAAQNIYSFDGNAGGTAGIAEMLLQSDGDQIELLPALPASWRDGYICGLRARGGFTVDLRWRDGRLDAARIHSSAAGSTRLRYGQEILEVTLDKGEAVAVGLS